MSMKPLSILGIQWRRAHIALPSLDEVCKNALLMMRSVRHASQVPGKNVHQRIGEYSRNQTNEKSASFS